TLRSTVSQAEAPHTPPAPKAAAPTLPTGKVKKLKSVNDPVGPLVVVGKEPPLMMSVESIIATLTDFGKVAAAALDGAKEGTRTLATSRVVRRSRRIVVSLLSWHRVSA